MIVKDEESIVVGTVKVKNISFEKEVVVRVTWDDWKNQQDIFCTFARVSSKQTSYKKCLALIILFLCVFRLMVQLPMRTSSSIRSHLKSHCRHLPSVLNSAFAIVVITKNTGIIMG